MPKKTVGITTQNGQGYIIPVKQNQKGLYNQIVEHTQTPAITAYSWNQHGPGRQVNCRLKVWTAPPLAEWPRLQRLITVTRKGPREGQDFKTLTYYLSSETGSAYLLAQRIRGPRLIENKLHWVKEVLFNEDNCPIGNPQLAVVMGVLRNIGFNLLSLAGFTSMTEGIIIMRSQVPQLWGIINQPILATNVFT